MAESTASSEIVKRESFDTADLRSLSSFDDAMRLFQDAGIPVADAAEAIGDGFEMLEDKDILVKQPFIMIQWAFTPGDFGEEYLIARVMTADGKKFVVTDGSTGLCRQVREFEQEYGAQRGLVCKRGLRKSEYFLAEDGTPSLTDTGNGKGSTYYLNV